MYSLYTRCVEHQSPFSFIQQLFIEDLLGVLDTESPGVTKAVYYMHEVSLVEFIFLGETNNK